MAHMQAYSSSVQQQPSGNGQIANQAVAQIGAENTSLSANSI